jgi:hypothetical protein
MTRALTGKTAVVTRGLGESADIANGVQFFRGRAILGRLLADGP